MSFRSRVDPHDVRIRRAVPISILPLGAAMIIGSAVIPPPGSGISFLIAIAGVGVVVVSIALASIVQTQEAAESTRRGKAG
jgi:hypothetical protein